MDLLDIFFPVKFFFKPFHEMYSDMALKEDDVFLKFKKYFEIDKLDKYSTINYDYSIKNKKFIKITSLKFIDFYQLVHIGYYGKYLDVYQIIRLNDKIRLEGEMKEKELPNRMEVLSWIDSVRKTLIKSIEEVKNIK